jgi:hypothetical protein
MAMKIGDNQMPARARPDPMNVHRASAANSSATVATTIKRLWTSGRARYQITVPNQTANDTMSPIVTSSDRAASSRVHARIELDHRVRGTHDQPYDDDELAAADTSMKAKVATCGHDHCAIMSPIHPRKDQGVRVTDE